MKIWYYLDNMGRQKGSINHQKIIDMAQGKKIMSCDISDFEGLLMSGDYNG
jgi:hypothetical protein